MVTYGSARLWENTILLDLSAGNCVPGMYPQIQKIVKILFSLKEDEKLLIEHHETKLLKKKRFGIHKDDMHSFKFSVNKVIQFISVNRLCLYVLLYVGSTVRKS